MLETSDEHDAFMWSMPANLGSSKASIRKSSRSGNLAKSLSSAGERDAAPDDASVHMSRRRESAAFREAGARFLEFWRRFGEARDTLEGARVALVESKGVKRPAIPGGDVAGGEGGHLAAVSAGEAARVDMSAGVGENVVAVAQAGEGCESVTFDLCAGELWVGEDNWAVLKQAVNRAGPLQGVPEVDSARLALRACEQLATEQNLEEIVRCLSLCSYVTSCPAVDKAKMVVSAQRELETEWSVYRMRELISVCGKLQGSTGLERCKHILKVWPPLISSHARNTWPSLEHLFILLWPPASEPSNYSHQPLISSPQTLHFQPKALADTAFHFSTSVGYLIVNIRLSTRLSRRRRETGCTPPRSGRYRPKCCEA